MESKAAMEIVDKYEYRYQYSNRFAYHPFHAMSMISGGSAALLWTSAIFIVGPKEPKYARGMGFIPLSTFDEALTRAQKIVGNSPRILCTPECFSGGLGVHLHTKS
jgi:hypothetical protein